MIFLSYRRSDSTPYSTLIRDFLTREFGAKRLFRDLEEIEAGEEYARVLKEKIGKSNAVLVLVGPKWLQEFLDRDGQTDYVVMEMKTAFGRRRPIIPVLVGGGRLPSEKDLENLPAETRDLVSNLKALNAVTYPDDVAGRDDAERKLLRRLHRLKGLSPLPRRLAIGTLLLVLLSVSLDTSFRWLPRKPGLLSVQAPREVTFDVVHYSDEHPDGVVTHSRLTGRRVMLLPPGLYYLDFHADGRVVSYILRQPSFRYQALEFDPARNEDGEDWAALPAGEYLIGDKRVQLSAFEIQRFEVTRVDYRTKLLEDPEALRCARRAVELAKGGVELPKDFFAYNEERIQQYSPSPTNPVIGLNFYQAYGYAISQGLSLPTEAEWAVGSGYLGKKEISRFPWGETEPAFYAVSSFAKLLTDDNRRTLSVGSLEKGKNPKTQVYDSLGNAREWVDQWRSGAPYELAEGAKQVVKGSGFDSMYLQDLVSPGVPVDADETFRDTVGFRCVRRRD
ncbi:MAG: SUMF1/EgtB/PvdO family nonheme iron enzyme [Vulcanimicrobiota bacterium]